MIISLVTVSIFAILIITSSLFNFPKKIDKHTTMKLVKVSSLPQILCNIQKLSRQVDLLDWYL